MFLISVTLFLTILIVENCALSTFDRDTRLNKDQHVAFNELKSRISSKPLPDYAKEDLYLLRFLRSSSFDVDKTVDYLFSDAKWKKENQIDDILTEDWSDFDQEYRQYLLGVDREGCPIVCTEQGDWDLRRAVLSGKRARVVRWYYRYMQQAFVSVREAGLAGKNVTRASLLVDLKGVSVAKQVNPQGIYVYAEVCLGLVQHYPNLIKNIIVVNTPPFFEIVIQTAKSIFPEDLRKQLIVLGTNKLQWKAELDKLIDPSQLSERFGGTFKTHDE